MNIDPGDDIGWCGHLITLGIALLGNVVLEHISNLAWWSLEHDPSDKLCNPMCNSHRLYSTLVHGVMC